MIKHKKRYPFDDEKIDDIIKAFGYFETDDDEENQLELMPWLKASEDMLDR